ncbi:hypothetical protein YTPLAS73_14830 [Nitrosarchaeum sp.]|nr:hypothetical protein YTPLAS73_14830 [Nitrosarchaeum sp.]
MSKGRIFCRSNNINRIKWIIKDMIKNKGFDIAITICGAWDHDIARHFSNYKEDLFTTDDGELKD